MLNSSWVDCHNNTPDIFNGSLLPYHNWTFDDYAMPEMPAWIPVSYLILLCVAIGVGIPGNLVTALAYFCVKSKNNCDWYIFFVAVFDLISCTFRVTGYLLEFLGVWAQLTNNSYCLFVSWVSQTSVGMSIFIVGLIAIDRCIKVSFNSRLTISPSQSRNICLIFTVLAFILGSPTLLIYGNTPRGICIVTRKSSGEPWVKFYYSTIFLLLFGMMAAVIFCYLSIAWTVMKNRRVIRIMPTYHQTQPNTSAETSRPAIKQRQPQLKQTHTFSSQTDRDTNRLAPPPTSSRHPPRRGQNRVISFQTSSDIEILPDVQIAGPSSDLDTMYIPQAPRLFVIPGPQTRAIRVQRPSRQITTSNKRKTSAKKITDTNMDVADHTELNLENVTEMYSRNSDESMKSRIQFSKEQWNKRIARDYKVTGLLFLVTTMFIVSWIAPMYATFRAFFVGITFPFTVEDVVILIYAPNLYIINNFINPIIYLALSATYREKVKQFFQYCVNYFSRSGQCRDIDLCHT